jgi:hypothetical protein
VFTSTPIVRSHVEPSTVITSDIPLFRSQFSQPSTAEITPNIETTMSVEPSMDNEPTIEKGHADSVNFYPQELWHDRERNFGPLSDYGFENVDRSTLPDLLPKSHISSMSYVPQCTDEVSKISTVEGLTRPVTTVVNVESRHQLNDIPSMSTASNINVVDKFPDNLQTQVITRSGRVSRKPDFYQA